jgi:hypothetical protein
MPRPKNKTDLIELGHANFNKLMDFVESMPMDQQEKEFPKGTLNRNIRDVLAHLHEWHLMMEEWYSVGMKGDKPYMPGKGYTWKTLPDLNKKINEQYATMPLAEAKKLLKQSFVLIQNIIKSHSNEELFTKKRYKWTGTTSLGAYLVSNTSSHYDWAFKLIKKCTK